MNKKEEQTIYCKTLRCPNIESNNFRKFICCHTCKDNFTCDTPCLNDTTKCNCTSDKKIVDDSNTGVGRETKR